MVFQTSPNPDRWPVEITKQFGCLLPFAGYSELEVTRYLAFHTQRIAPCMERGPTVLRTTNPAGTGLSSTHVDPRSTLTTDGSPIEYSLSFAGQSTAVPSGCLSNQTRWRTILSAFCKQSDWSRFSQPIPRSTPHGFANYGLTLTWRRERTARVNSSCGEWDTGARLGQQIPYPGADRQSIRTLYQAIAGDDGRTAHVHQEWNREGVSTGSAYHVKKPMTGYFSLQPSKRTPKFKLLVRAQKPFIANDLDAAKRLMGWMQTQTMNGHAWATPQDGLEYIELLEDMFPYRSLADDNGLHCWITVSIKKGKLIVESYLPPELFKQEERLETL